MKYIKLFEEFENEPTNFSDVFSKCASISQIDFNKNRRNWMSEYANYHQLNSNTGNTIEFKENLCIGFDDWTNKNSKNRKISRYDWESGKWL